MKAIAKWTTVILGSLMMTVILINGALFMAFHRPQPTVSSVGVPNKILVEEQQQLPVSSVGTFTGDHADIAQTTTIPPTEKQPAPPESRKPQAAADTQDDDFDRKARELAKAFRTANPETQARLRKELDALNERHFEYRQQQRQHDIERLTSRLDALRLLQLRRAQNKTEVLKRRVEELLDPNSDLDWGGTETPDSLLTTSEETGRTAEDPVQADARMRLGDSNSTPDSNQDDSSVDDVTSDYTDPDRSTTDAATSILIKQLNLELSEIAKVIKTLKHKIDLAQKRYDPRTAARYASAYGRDLAIEQQKFDKKLKQLKEFEQLATQPRYEGRTLEEWLRVLKTERSLAKLKTALVAINSLKQDAEPRLLIDAILRMSQSLPSLQANNIDIIKELYSITSEASQDTFIDALLAELNEVSPGNVSKGLITLVTLYFEPQNASLRIDTGYSTFHVFAGRADQRPTLRNRADELLNSLAKIAQQHNANDHWVILNAHYILGACQSRLALDSDLIPVVERAFLSSSTRRIQQAAGVMLGESGLKLDEVTEFFRQELKREAELTFDSFQFTCDRIKDLTRTQSAAAQLLIEELEERVRSFGSGPISKLNNIYILAHTLAEIGEPAKPAIPVLQTLHDSEIAENGYSRDNPRLEAILDTRSLFLRDHIADAIKQIQEAKPKPKLEPLPSVERSATFQPKPSQDIPGPTVPAESDQTGEMTFDGIPYSQWLKLLETERKPEKLAAAMQACSRLLKPGDERRVARAIFLGAQAFEKGEPTQLDLVWTAGKSALGFIPSEAVVEELLVAFRDDRATQSRFPFQYYYFRTEVENESTPLMQFLKTHPDEVLNELTKRIEQNGEGSDSLLAAASTILRLSNRSLDDFKMLHARLLRLVEETPPVPINQYGDAYYSYHWRVAVGNLVLMAPDTPDLAFKLMKHEKGTSEVFELVGMLKRHAEPVVPQLVELFLEEWKRVEAAKAAAVSSNDAAAPGGIPPQVNSPYFKLTKIVRTLGDIGIGPSGYALLRQLSLIAPASNRGEDSDDKRFFDAVEWAIRSFASDGRTETHEDLLSDASLITGRWTVQPEKPADESAVETWLIESRFISTYGRLGDGLSIGSVLRPAFAYELDAGTNPKQISLYNFEFTRDGGFGGRGRQLRREIPGSRHLGIYELTETELRLQFSKPGEPRPTELVTDESKLPAGQTLLKLNRKLDERLLIPIPKL